MNDLSASGVWWDPDQPEDKIGGRLTFDDDGIYLELHGAFEPASESFTRWLRLYSPTVIFGATVDGKKVSLHQCFNAGSSSSGGVTQAKYHASRLLVGVHVRAADLAVAVLEIHSPEFERWFALAAFRQRFPRDGQIPRTISLDFDLPETVQVRVGQRVFTVSSDIDLDGDHFSRYEMRHMATLAVAFDEPVSLDEAVNTDLYHLQNLFTLAIGDIIDIDGVWLRLPDHTEKVALYFQTSRSAKHRRRPIAAFEIRFRFEDIRDNWGIVLERLYDAGERLRPVFDLFFSTLYASDIYAETHFLNLAQALESYHRRSFEVMLADQTLFEAIRERVLAVLADTELDLTNDARRTLIGKTKYWNEIGLRRRLRELLLSHRRLVERIVPNIKAFVGQVVDTRNYLTHYDPTLESAALTDRRLWVATEKLRYLLELCFLHELDTPIMASEKVVSQARRWLNVMNANADAEAEGPVPDGETPGSVADGGV